MKRIVATLCLFFGLFISGMAQTTASKADEKAVKEAQKKADKEKKKEDKDAAKAAKATSKSTGTNKDGSPDMRLKVNKDAAKAKQTPAPVVNNPTVTKPVVTTPAVIKPTVTAPVVTKPAAPKVTPPQPATTPAVKTVDKVIGTDDKGRTIYEGSRGGHYYINKNGNKEYVKKS